MVKKIPLDYFTTISCNLNGMLGSGYAWCASYAGMQMKVDTVSVSPNGGGIPTLSPNLGGTHPI